MSYSTEGILAPPASRPRARAGAAPARPAGLRFRVRRSGADAVAAVALGALWLTLWAVFVAGVVLPLAR